MPSKAEQREGAPAEQIRNERAHDAGSAARTLSSRDDDQDAGELHSETLMIIRLLLTESPAFASQ